MTNLDIINRVLKDEGADTNDPADHGGFTHFGMTAAGVADWPGLMGREVADLTLADAYIFYQWLMDSSGVSKIINEELRYIVFDAVVNMGASAAVKQLQRALGLVPDGIIGPVTLAATPHLDSSKLGRLVLAEKMLFYGRLAAGNPTQLKFLNGWLERTARQMRELA